jgi:hypothetical protein
MSYRFHGRANVDPNNPRAFGRCDRCGFIYNQSSLRFQFDFRGPQLQNLRFLVCNNCYDRPQTQLKPIIVTQDPTPIINARPEDYVYANSSYLAATEPTTTYQQTGISVDNSIDLVTENEINIVTQPIGVPTGLNPNAVMPLQGTTHYDVVLPVISITANGTTVITVTCSSAHGLSTNSQVSVENLTDNKASGFYSVTVTTATAFTYTVASPIVAGSLIDGNTRVATANVGLPTGFTQIPQVGALNG